MKGLFWVILGILVAWIVVSFFTNNWNTGAPIYLILGIVVGHQIGKQNKDKSVNDSL